MKKLIIPLILLSLLFISCKDEPPVIPGITKSKIKISTDPDTVNITINSKDLQLVNTPYFIDDLEPGFYKIDLKRATYLDTSIYYLLKRNVTDTLIIEMRENPPFWWKSFSLGTELLSKIKIDKNNTKWIATKGSGLLKFETTGITRYNKLNSGIADDVVNDIFLNDDGSFWLATAKGFCYYNGSSWKVFNKVNSSITDDYITSISVDKNNVVWAGSVAGGLIRFDGVMIKEYNISNSGITSNHVSALFVDDNNVKWIGTWGSGISTFNDSVWKAFSTFNSSLTNNFISVIKYDNQKNICAGTGSLNVYNGALSIFKNNTWINYTRSNSSLPGSMVYDFATDSKGTFWIATENGMAWLSSKGWKIYSKDNSGLPANFVVSIGIDSEDIKWMLSSTLSEYWGGR